MKDNTGNLDTDWNVYFLWTNYWGTSFWSIPIRKKHDLKGSWWMFHIRCFYPETYELIFLGGFGTLLVKLFWHCWNEFKDTTLIDQNNDILRKMNTTYVSPWSFRMFFLLISTRTMVHGHFGRFINRWWMNKPAGCWTYKMGSNFHKIH
jgi:hypothetical protein